MNFATRVVKERLDYIIDPKGPEMIEVRELSRGEIEEFVMRQDYCHLACCDGGRPYVVPVHYAYEDGYVYIYTTQGKKSEILSVNPNICLQIEEVRSNTEWTSVILFGEAQELHEEDDRTKAIDAVVKINPTLTPAVSIRWIDNWVRENIEVIYRIVPLEMTGRASVERSETPASFVPGKRPADV